MRVIRNVKNENKSGRSHIICFGSNQLLFVVASSQKGVQFQLMVLWR